MEYGGTYKYGCEDLVDVLLWGGVGSVCRCRGRDTLYTCGGDVEQ
jgi:hypothetical protein